MALFFLTCVHPDVCRPLTGAVLQGGVGSCFLRSLRVSASGFEQVNMREADGVCVSCSAKQLATRKACLQHGNS